MASSMIDSVQRWAQTCGIAPERLPSSRHLIDNFGSGDDALREPLRPDQLRAWERRHDIFLPASLRALLLITNGFYRGMPFVHPLEAIGPIILFGQMPGMLIQPETWFEFGNPNVETIGVDLGYTWPTHGGDYPIITSGDTSKGRYPRVIASGFAEWFLQLLDSGGNEFWMEPGFRSLGDAWTEHRLRAPQPSLSRHLMPIVSEVESMILQSADERTIADAHGLDFFELEQILRHVQHRTPSGSTIPAPPPPPISSEIERAASLLL